SGSQATINKAGRVTITANQTGNDSYRAAAPVDQNFCISPPKPTITISNASTETPTLTSSASIGNQWYVNGTAIPGATNNTLTAALSGAYKVQVKEDDCTSEFSEEMPLVV